jgi:hypothetical protein
MTGEIDHPLETPLDGLHSILVAFRGQLMCPSGFLRFLSSSLGIAIPFGHDEVPVLQ